MDELNLPALRGGPGYCKVCASPNVAQINKMLRDGRTSTKIIEWAGEFGEHFVRQTLYKHKEHITDPKTTFVERAKKNPIIKRASNEEFLDAVRDAGMAKVLDDPDSVSIGQALKAAQISMNAKKTNNGIQLVLVGVMTGRADDVIEGEWKES